jgi:hypothetical protein
MGKKNKCSESNKLKWIGNELIMMERGVVRY